MEGFKRFKGFKRVACLVVAVALVAPLHSQTPNFIWKVTGTQSVVYLVGSVHALSAEYYPLSPVFDAAFKDSDLLVEEVDLGEMSSPATQMALLMRGMLPPGQSLEQILSAATLARVNKFVGDLGVPIEPLRRFKPWMLAIALEGIELQKAGFDPALGLDKHFYDLARSQVKAVQGFETAEYQISRFDQMTNDQQDRFLAEALKELESQKAGVDVLAKAWRAGDVSTVERLVLQDLKSDPVMYQRLLVERNRNWFPTLESLLNRRGHAFVVVGAAHLVGPDGLLTMLRSKGHVVEQQ